jgi:hypothetical protein
MNYNRSRLLLVLAGVLIVVGWPLAGKLARRQEEPRCEQDGMKIESLYSVRVVGRDGESHSFCCPRCARAWLERSGGEAAVVYVTDEADGGEIDARAAHFVRSSVVTNPVTVNRIHAFRHRADAERHARAFGGSILMGADRPFRDGAGLAEVAH